MFIYSIMHQNPGNEAIAFAAQKMLPASGKFQSLTLLLI